MSFMMRSLILIAILAVPLFCFGQTANLPSVEVRSSAAYSEVLLRKTELEADLVAFLADYTEQNPKIIDLRYELAELNKSVEKVFAVKPAEGGKLTLALGKLIVKKAGLDTELARLTRSYGKDHPEVKRAARRAEIFDTAIKQVLR